VKFRPFVLKIRATKLTTGDLKNLKKPCKNPWTLSPIHVFIRKVFIATGNPS